MAEKKRRGRRAHLDEFYRDLSGSYIYTGAHYIYMDEGIPLKKALAVLWALAAAMAVLTVLGGCIPASGMKNSFYQIIPYILEVAAVGSIVWALVRLTRSGDPLRAYIYEATVKALPGRAVLAIIAAGLGFCGTVLHLILRGAEGQIAATILYLIFKLLIAGGAVSIRKYLQKLTWSTPEPPAPVEQDDTK
jgi:hypothetical protein